jgi:hypothetical protein
MTGFRLSEKCAEQRRASALIALERQHMTREQATIAVAETAEDLVVRNLVEALSRIHADLERIEVWTAALACFQEAVPQYQPDSDYLLPPRNRAAHST